MRGKDYGVGFKYTSKGDISSKENEKEGDEERELLWK